MIEFAVITFVLTAMLSAFLGLIVLGLGSFQNNLSAESAGRLLDRKLPDSLSGAQDIYDALKTEGLYDEQYLIISATDWFDAAFRADLPEINRSMLGNYIFDPDLGAYRYPGAIVRNSLDQPTVLIPLLRNTTPPVAKGIYRALNVTVDDVPVSDDWVGPLCIAATDDDAVYRVVIFLPSQPGSMLNLEIVRDTDGRIVSQTPLEANDDAISLSPPPSGYTLDPPAVTPGVPASTSRGEYGLGETYAFLKTVRPYRRIFESASVFRLAEP